MLSHLRNNNKKSLDRIYKKFPKLKPIDYTLSDSESSIEILDSDDIKTTKLINEVCNTITQSKLKTVKELFKKYSNELEDFIYIDSKSLTKLKFGGIIRYVNSELEIRFGGVFLAYKNDESIDRLIFILKQRGNIYYNVRFCKHFIFFREQRTKNYYKKQMFINFSETLENLKNKDKD